ncbi:hypothetical protein GCM10009682_39230 [Luedemannella flava]|uniref:DUF3618 domain-containing protein n=1 Tax=Luedemannella flava TaxID=349316 RepID=A0ABN2M852_9ACTN
MTTPDADRFGFARPPAASLSAAAPASTSAEVVRLPADKPGPPPTRDELRREISELRTDLAEALSALVAKSDVKARVTGEFAHLRARAVESVRRRRMLLIVGVVVAAAVAGAVAWQARDKERS